MRSLTKTRTDKVRVSTRDLKTTLFVALQSDDLQSGINTILTIPPRRVINTLFSFLLSTDPIVKWHAVTAFGRVVAKMADQEMESARVIMRRLMWQLNDESGGIGWGCPEAMAESLAMHEALASEYSMVLLSYIREDGNFLEYEPLQEGALWGVGRLSLVNSQLTKSAIPHVLPFLESPRASLRGLAVWALGLLGARQSQVMISRLLRDQEELGLYRYEKYQVISVSRLAKEALCLLKKRLG